MSVVRDLFKLRKYNIHEVNKQIHHLHKSLKTEEVKTDDQNIETTNNHDNEDSKHRHPDETGVNQAHTEKKDNVNEHQVKSDGTLDETVAVADSSFEDAKDTGREENYHETQSTSES